MTYWFLTSGNNQRDYSTFFEASTKCYPPWWNRLCVIEDRNQTPERNIEIKQNLLDKFDGG